MAEFTRKHLGKPRREQPDPLTVVWRLRQELHALGCVNKLDDPYANCRLVLKRKRDAV